MLKEGKYEINPSSTGITEADGDKANFKDIWDFKVSLNTWIILQPTDLFAAKLYGDDAAEMPKATRLRVVRRDVSNEDSKPVLSEIYYQLAKDFTDLAKLMHLSIKEKIEVGPEEHIVVQIAGLDATGTGDTDASASYFKILTTRRKVSIG